MARWRISCDLQERASARSYLHVVSDGKQLLVRGGREGDHVEAAAHPAVVVPEGTLKGAGAARRRGMTEGPGLRRKKKTFVFYSQALLG